MLRPLATVAVVLSLIAATSQADAKKPVVKKKAPAKKVAVVAAPPPPAAAPAPAPAPAPPPAPTPAPVVEAPLAPPPILVAPDRDVVKLPDARPRRVLTVTLNPLPMAAGRYGANVEYVPLAHHAIALNAYYQSLQPWVLDRILPKEVERGTLPGRFGGEIGYRLYSGAEGASGVFAGISGVAMPIFYPRVTEQLRAEVAPVDAYGGALDVGVQAILGSGFTVGGGVGVMALAYTPPTSVKAPAGVDAPSFVEPHVLPRLLLAAGWSF